MTTLVQNVGVDHRGFHARVAEEFLDGADIVTRTAPDSPPYSSPTFPWFGRRKRRGTVVLLGSQPDTTDLGFPFPFVQNVGR
jgi:hypothetical protein